MIDLDRQQRSWFKSTLSSGSCACVEVRFKEGSVAVRDSKYLRNPDNDPATQPMITIAVDEWMSFLSEVAGEACVSHNRCLRLETASDGSVLLQSISYGTTLGFTADEWSAFVGGVQAGEFTPALSGV